jgi:hypothetical protein
MLAAQLLAAALDDQAKNAAPATADLLLRMAAAHRSVAMHMRNAIDAARVDHRCTLDHTAKAGKCPACGDPTGPKAR